MDIMVVRFRVTLRISASSQSRYGRSITYRFCCLVILRRGHGCVNGKDACFERVSRTRHKRISRDGAQASLSVPEPLVAAIGEAWGARRRRRPTRSATPSPSGSARDMVQGGASRYMFPARRSLTTPKHSRSTLLGR